MSASGTVVAGYRLVRLVGRGSRCEVHLARPCRSSDQASGPAANVAVKIVPATERSRGEAEIVALQAVSSDHVVALRDVATLADGSLCIVQSLGQRGTASALLGRRGSITPGETVTLVASVLRGLGDLHDAGIAHGSVDLTHVVLDATGRPLLSGLGSSRVIAGGAGADGLPGADPVEEDLGRVSRIVRALRDPTDARRRASEDRWEGWLALLDAAIHGETDLTAHDLADGLLDVADAAPLADAGTSPGSSDDHRIVPPGVTREAVGPGLLEGRVARTAEPRRGGRPHAVGRRGDHRRHRAARDRRADRARSRGRAMRARVTGELASVRPGIWVLGACALLLLLAGAIAVPALTSPARGATAEPTSAPTPSASAPASGDAAPSAASDPDVEAAASPDPDAAAPALLRLRASCLRRGDVGCLAEVDETGSPVEDADRSAVASDASAALDDAALHVADALGPAQRLGESALIGLRPEVAPGSETSAPARRPASLLIVRGEAGWRIRDMMDDR
ncbi:protein kinase domain-containing protein [Clavibacter michiganensis]|uniref:Serine/threonine protein kinase n=1 Tax=Clavibacter michiganensis subsp. insidiosus TaxID=33014 RepID=A0A399REV9_9MICO|nr:protein kinase [Clavibacter michiganensis]AWG01451.1 serine/threonine protein kinase [Clavibacter michiganensis subsp. insidiosus]RIJ29928.1 serine/threonine protein kinase [Clavibacter michiganensis subsp. insidiosus]